MTIAKILVLMLAIDIMLFVGGVNAGTNLLVFGDLVSIDVIRTENNTFINGTYNLTNFTNTVIPEETGIANQIAQVFIIPLTLALDFLNIIFSVLFAPSIFMNAVGAPFEVSLLVGATLMMIYILGFASIVRGYDI